MSLLDDGVEDDQNGGILGKVEVVAPPMTMTDLVAFDHA
jgi:hypothetical protein